MSNYKEIPLSNGGYATVSDSDYELLIRWKWHRHKQGYAVRNSSSNHISMHQQIMGKKEGFEIDHKDRIKLNNTRDNLRFVTRSQNNLNRPVDPRNKVGHNGISKLSTGSFRVRLSKKDLGRYKTLEEAIEVRRRHELELPFLSTETKV